MKSFTPLPNFDAQQKREAHKKAEGGKSKHEKTRPFCQLKPCRTLSLIPFLPVIIHIPLTHAIIIRMAGNNLLHFLRLYILSYTIYRVNKNNKKTEPLKSCRTYHGSSKIYISKSWRPNSSASSCVSKATSIILPTIAPPVSSATASP